MKKTLITLLFIALAISAFGQRKERQEWQERIQALKIAFITDKLELSEVEAQKFWPVYNAIEGEKKELRKEAQKMRKDLDFESLTDAQANTLIKDMIALENRKHNLHSKQVNELLKVIPAKKIILLKVVEEQFNKRMLKEMKDRREKLKKNKP